MKSKNSLIEKYSLFDASDLAEEKLSGGGFFRDKLGDGYEFEIKLSESKGNILIEACVNTVFKEISHDDIVSLGQQIYGKFFEAVEHVNSDNVSQVPKKKFSDFLLVVNGKIVYTID